MPPSPHFEQPSRLYISPDLWDMWMFRNDVIMALCSSLLTWVICSPNVSAGYSKSYSFNAWERIHQIMPSAGALPPLLGRLGGPCVQKINYTEMNILVPRPHKIAPCFLEEASQEAWKDLGIFILGISLDKLLSKALCEHPSDQGTEKFHLILSRGGFEIRFANC